MTVHNSKMEREYLVHVSIMYLVTFVFLIYAHQIQQQITELRSHIFYNFFHIQMFLTNKAILIKFIYSEKATKFCEISTVDLTVTT